MKALADDAPAALLAAADGIRGLSIDGDEVLLDGVAWTNCRVRAAFLRGGSGATTERQNKLLCVDGLEVLDAEHRHECLSNEPRKTATSLSRHASPTTAAIRREADSIARDNICPTPPCAHPGATHNS